MAEDRRADDAEIDLADDFFASSSYPDLPAPPCGDPAQPSENGAPPTKVLETTPRPAPTELDQYQPRQVLPQPRPLRKEPPQQPPKEYDGDLPPLDEEAIRDIVAGQPVEETDNPQLTEGAGALRDRKSHVPKLLSEDDFEADLDRLESERGPAWERSDTTSSAVQGESDEDEWVRIIVPAEDGGNEGRWVTVRREELFSPTQRRLRRLGRWAVLAAAAAVVCTAAWRFLDHYVSSFDSTHEPAPRAAPRQGPEEEPGEREITLSAAEADAAETQIRAFCAAPFVEARLIHVRQPKRVAPLMRRWARQHGDGPIQIGKRLRQKKLAVGEARFVVLAFETESDPYYAFLAAEQLPDGRFLTDWEFSVGYQPLAVEDFMRNRPAEATPFRVKVKPSDYHDYRFPADEFSCYTLTYPGKDLSLFGYARRDSPVADFLERSTIAAAPSLILGLRYPEGSRDAKRVEIAELVNDSWFY